MLLLSTLMVQEGQIPRDQRPTLERTLKDAVRLHVGTSARLAIAWQTVPRGSGYSAGRPSKTSIVQLGVPDGFEQHRREALMNDVCARWCRVTGQTPYDLVISTPEKTVARQLIRGLLAQVSGRQKVRLLATHLSQLTRSLAFRR